MKQSSRRKRVRIIKPSYDEVWENLRRADQRFLQLYDQNQELVGALQRVVDQVIGKFAEIRGLLSSDQPLTAEQQQRLANHLTDVEEWLAGIHAITSGRK